MKECGRKMTSKRGRRNEAVKKRKKEGEPRVRRRVKEFECVRADGQGAAFGGRARGSAVRAMFSVTTEAAL